MIENIGAVEQSLGLESGKLSEMLSSEESHSIDLDSRVFFNKEDYNTRITNIKDDVYIKGQEEMLKKMKLDEGLEYDGRKDPNNFIAALKSKIEKESTKEPEQRFADLNTKFEQMQGISKDWETKFSDLQGENTREKNQFKINSTLLKEIPDNIVIGKEDVLSILKSKNDFSISDDGSVILMKNGKPLENSATLNSMSPSEFMKDLIKPYLKAVEGGRGDEGGSTPSQGSLESFQKEMEGKGVKGEKFNEEMQKRISNGTLKL